MSLRRTFAALVVASLAAPPVHAAAWGVGPLRVDLDRAARSGLVNVSNDDTTKLNFSIRLMRWSQDDNGADRYEPSDDLVYFPRAAEIAPTEKRAIRVGSRGESPAVEKTYRLFIEEMPDVATMPQKGVGVAVKGRFAIPIFVAPAQGAAKGEFVDAVHDKDGITVRLRNTGNRHFKIDTFVVRNGDTVVKEGNGWYVLAGATRAFKLPFGGAECGAHTLLQVHLKGEAQEFRQPVTLDRARCGP